MLEIKKKKESDRKWTGSIAYRQHCLIDGCRRTRPKDGQFDEWICQKHWSVVPKKYRKLYSMAKRKFKNGRIGAERIQRIWNKCKEQAFMNAWCV